MNEPRLQELIRYHEALLMTLRASKHYWIAGVYKNAAAAYVTLRNKWEKEDAEASA